MFKYLIPIFLISLFLRTYGLNWDQGFHLHPDERFLTMVAAAMKFSQNYFDTRYSLLNPHNVGFEFYVYGTWPVILTKLVSLIVSMDNYDQLILVGRFLSALFDSSSSILIFLISLRLFKNKLSATISSLIYSITFLPIQLAHFYTVDTFLVFFLTLTLYLLIINTNAIFLGLAFGLALSAKISAILFLPVIFLKIIFDKTAINNKIKFVITFLLSLLIVFRIFYPYLFDGLSLNQKVLANWKTLKTFDVPGYFPPSVQWMNTPKYIYPLTNTIFFGLGLPLGLVFLISLIYSPKILKAYPVSSFLYLWIVGLFIYQGAQIAKPLRYLYPIYPSLAIICGYYISKLKIKSIVGLFLITIVWIFGFLNIYSVPHPRVRASEWILRNIPYGSKISCEYWDDCLPLINTESFKTVQISPYDADSPTKIYNLKSQISSIDYLIFSSNRLYGSIPQAYQFYPYTLQFYNDLFAEKLGFVKVAEFTSRPNWPIPGLNICLNLPFFNYGYVSKQNQSCNQTGISLVDDYAEESITVYDHPKVTIFKNISL